MDKETMKRIETLYEIMDRHSDSIFEMKRQLSNIWNILEPKDTKPAPVREPVRVIRRVEYYEGDTVIGYKGFDVKATVCADKPEPEGLIKVRLPVGDTGYSRFEEWSILFISLYARAGAEQ
jgi:hypothetical protein